MPASAPIALLTDSRFLSTVGAEPQWYVQNILADDALLSAALLQNHGLSSVRVDWANPHFDWSQVRAAVFRTTWDYFERITEFSAWIDRNESVTKLINPAPLVRWNLDKHYLRDLQAKGIRIPSTLWLEKGQSFSWSQLQRELASPEIIVKPAISGGARNTFRVNRANASEVEAKVNVLLSTQAFLVQPFLSSVVEQGELSLMIFGGQYTHAVRKIAKAGDFRVQDDFGGRVEPYQPSAAEIAFAERSTAVSGMASAYARVDIVRDAQGELALMEWEGIEPEIFLRFHPQAAEVFAASIARSLG